MNKAGFFPLMLLLALWIAACGPKKSEGEKQETLSLEIERHDPRLDQIIDPEAEAVILGSGFEWTEGPLWLEKEQKLLFSDIPYNRVHSWTAEEGVSIYLEPAGFTGEGTRGGELGSNGLLLDPEGALVLCQHGDRRMAKMKAPLNSPKAEYETIVDNFEGMRFNSPNDAAYDAGGDLYFTDPPYGLEKNMEDPSKEIPFQGVYRFSKEGELTLLLDSISRPNGLAFSPDGGSLIIANSDPAKPIWYAYSVSSDGDLSQGRIFYDATEEFKTDKGLPDGLKVRKDGLIFATGPGGVWIFDQQAKVLGRLKVGELTSNVALDKAGKNLYVTADSYVVRIALK
ncbi:SMP-30/gluconolactonase/LRE family protein [Negadavirga shengliensis]|uniref:SMP-30/gluconolactonase/LRE family protein n=1 Tax=Negadavirga shengliensis TaxID=1389218 RepID=A0ABV9SZL8_9BACT